MQAFRTAVYLSGARDPDLAALRAAGLDIAILDLEDSVAPEQKRDARAAIAVRWAALRQVAAQVIVRINAPLSDEGREDLEALKAIPDAVVLVAKPVTSQALAAVAPREVWAMAEEADLAGRLAGLIPRPAGLVVGFKDLSLDLGYDFPPMNPGLRAAAEALLEAARSLGLPVLDGVALGDVTQVSSAAGRARRQGFAGVTLVRAADAVHASKPE
jgi:citrate lyase subunit beta/citryl-CoA lyase